VAGALELITARAGRRRLRPALIATVALCAAASLAACGAARPRLLAIAGTPVKLAVDAGARSTPPEHHADVTVGRQAKLTSVPRSYFGLSTEYWALAQYERRTPLLERVLSLLHVRGDGPMMLRIGGDSADHAFWDPRLERLPRWAFTLTPRWLARTRGLVRRLGVRLIIDLNLITDSPATAARWARAAQTGLPHRSIAGFEIGNEPDIYNRSNWLAAIAGQPLDGRVLPGALTAEDYAQAFRAYAEALARAAPGVPLAGPALANPDTDSHWVSSLLDSDRRVVGLVTVHRYPYSACAEPRSSGFPTISRLLSARASVGMARSLRPTVRIAHAAGLALRVTELNSVTCGGRAGVSNTFATALWAPDALFELLRNGVDGVNVHVRADAINAPFAITGGGLTARPLLYGLILFVRTLGSHPELVRLHLRAAASLNLQAWAVAVGGGTLHVLLIDKGSRSVNVALHLPTTGDATVQRLLAPAASSEFGVTLGGRQLGRDGRWQGLSARQTLVAGSHGYRLSVPRLSAALVSARIGSRSDLSRLARRY
jgi:Glycosyl hydrolase family 79 C-terminal beta domain